MTTSTTERIPMNEHMKNLPLHQFFTFELKDLYWAENHIADALPNMIDAATSPALKSALDAHLDETRDHIVRLQIILNSLKQEAEETTCKAMAGILLECKDIISETKKGSAVRDAAIIMAAQKVEHYEITSYGSLIRFSELMHHDEATSLLQETLDEEYNADNTLTDLGEDEINDKALEEN